MTTPHDLAQLFDAYGSDKDRNGYAQLYATILAPMRERCTVDRPIDMLEIGIGTLVEGAHSSMVGYSLEGYRPGGSLRAWRDWFGAGARIVGADVQPDTQFEEIGIRTVLCDSTSRKSVVDTFGHEERFDVIIDDGSHVDAHQLFTLTNAWPLLRAGGIYVIEDIYPHSAISAHPKALEGPTGGAPFFFVGLKNNLCVFTKTTLASKRQNY